MPSYDPAWGKASPGRLLLEHLIECSFREGLRAFDFTIGDEPYKASFCNVSDELYRRMTADLPRLGVPAEGEPGRRPSKTRGARLFEPAATDATRP